MPSNYAETYDALVEQGVTPELIEDANLRSGWEAILGGRIRVAYDEQSDRFLVDNPGLSDTPMSIKTNRLIRFVQAKFRLDLTR